MGSGGYPSLATDNFCFDDATAVHVEGAVAAISHSDPRFSGNEVTGKLLSTIQRAI